MKTKTNPFVSSFQKQFVKDYMQARANADSDENRITDRIDSIIKYIYKSVHKTLHSWYFDGAEEGCIGPAYEAIRFAFPDGLIDGIVYDENFSCEIIDSDGDVIDLADSIPVRWLWDDYEVEITNGIVLNKKRNEAVKEKRASAGKKKKDAVAQAKSKLTKDEQKLLGIK